jgi:hypothetical protein
LQVAHLSTFEFVQVGAAVEELKASEGVGNGKSSIFVARARETLEKVLRDCDLYHLPLLTGFRRATPLPNLPILPGHPTWQLVGDGSTELAKKGYLVRVLVHAPRKGVFDSGAIIYFPLHSDLDSYFSSYVSFVAILFLRVLFVIVVQSCLVVQSGLPWLANLIEFNFKIKN